MQPISTAHASIYLVIGMVAGVFLGGMAALVAK